MRTESGIVEQLESLGELFNVNGCSDDYFTQARSEALQTLTARPDVRWIGCLPGFRQVLPFSVFLIFLGILLGGCLYSVEVRSPAIITSTAVLGPLVWFAFVVSAIRRDRLRKAKWTKLQRMAELEQLHKLRLITADEYEQMQASLERFV